MLFRSDFPHLIHPTQVLKEVNWVLKAGRKAILSQSNRCFSTKAVRMWLGINNRQHLELINAYFQYAGGYEARKAFDITATVQNGHYQDPMFLIEAPKT